MQLFGLSALPSLAAPLHCNKHVGKQSVECASDSGHEVVWAGCCGNHEVLTNHARARGKVNEIVLEEESDEAPATAGAVRYLSHFEMYVESMQEVASDTAGINHFLDRVRLDGVDAALKTDIAPAAANDFMRTTFEIVGEGKLHEVAAAFALGREHVIPRMFRSLLAEMNIGDELAPTFHYYLSRHVELDELEHGPMAMRMLDVLCEGHPFREAEAVVAAQKSLEARLKFWDSVEQAL